MNYGRAIRIARAAVNMPQHELAKKCDLTPSYLSQIEKEARTPSLSAIERICSALKLPMHLMTLLAAEKDDIKGPSVETAQRLALEMLQLLVNLGQKGDRDGDRTNVAPA